MNASLAKDIVQWDVSNWSEALRFWESKLSWNDKNRDCLEIGAKRGGLSLWLALKGYHVICSDLTDTESRALPLHKKYGVESLVRYEDIDATNMPYTDAFDLIVFKSVLGGIGASGGKIRQATAMAQVYRALRPGGKLLFAENLAATRLHKLLRERFVRWGKTWRYLTLPEMNEFLQPYSSFCIHSTGLIGALGRTESAKRLLSTIDQAFLNRLSPMTWRYIGYGIATK